MANFRDLATRAMRAASEARRRGQVSRIDPVCVYDLAERLGVEVKFIDAASLEGMYSQSQKGTIVLPALHHRPPGRLAFSCAHELGHHMFGHGTRVDQYLKHKPKTRNSSEEWLADCFAGSLLMPRAAVVDSFQRRAMSAESASPFEFYTVAGELGVGYRTLISHLKWALKLIPASTAETLERSSPKRIRAHFLPGHEYPHAVVVDRFWKGSAVAVDLRVGDAAIFPVGTEIEGDKVEIVTDSDAGLVIVGSKVGLGRALLSPERDAVFIRISKARYVGRSIFRHLEDPDEHCQPATHI